MAEEVALYIANFAIEELGFTALQTAAAGAFLETYGTYIAVAASVYTLHEQQRRARDAYNNGLTNRYVMQRAASAPRSMVLGRARVSGPLTFVHSFGTNNASLVLCVVLAAHECDAIEDVYFNDTPLILDAGGNVVGTKNVEHFTINDTTATFTLGAVGVAGTASATATYDTGDVALGVSMSGDGLTLSITGGTAGKIASVIVTYQPYVVVYTPTRIQDTNTQQTASGSTGTFVASAGLIAASVAVVSIGADGAQTALSFTVSRSGLYDWSVNYSGATAGQVVHLMYQAGSTYSRARITKHLGGPGQVADADLLAELPGLWTSNHIGTGLCYLKIELDYDPGTFPSGIPNISAVVRGMKCFDPRTSTTAWTDNPALLMRAYYTHPLGANRSAAEVNDTTIIAAANVCDGQVTYHVGTHAQTRARYKASTVVAKDRKPQDALTDLAHAMGGRWVINGNQLVVKAGAYTSPVAVIDESWIHSGSAVSMQPRPNRSDMINSVLGSYADEEQAFQTVPFPAVKAATYITTDGHELQATIDYPAVTYSGQAQYLSQSAIRYNRAGLTVKMSCNMRAYPLEVFDVVSVSLARFGWSSKTFEVLATGFSIDGLIELSLKEIDSTIWTLDALFLATDYAVKTLLPNPWVIPVPVITGVASGTNYLLRQADGTISSRIFVSFAAITDTNVLQGGFIDVAYMRANDPTYTWTTESVPGDATGILIAGVNDGAVYLVKARARNRLAEGNWCTQVTHQVIGKSQPPSLVTSFALAIIPGAMKGTRTPSTELDYDHTLYRYGPSFAAGTRVPGTSDAAGFVWPWPALGSYTVWVVDVDSSGNMSTPVGMAITVTASIYIGSEAITPDAGWLNSNVGLPRGNAITLNPECSLASAWDAPVFGSGNAGMPGGTYVANNVGLSCAAASRAVTPIDSSRKYRVSCLVASNDGTGVMYLGLTWRTPAASETVLTGFDATGWPSAYPPGGNTYWGRVNESPTVGPTRYSIDFGPGTGVPIPTGASGFRLLALLNYAQTSNTAQHQISDYKVEDITDVSAARLAASNAALAASAAQTAANTANGVIAVISSDSMLSQSEKPELIKQWNAIAGQQSSLRAQAVSMGLDVSGVDTPYAALAAYLNSLRNTDGSGDANSWQNLATDCPSDGPTMRARFLAYTNGAVALLNAIAAKAATLATWAGTTGSGKPADGATVGAPTGTYVGSQLAEALVQTASNAAIAASAAQTAANIANGVIAIISSDSMLSQSEKPELIKQWNAIAGQQSSLRAQAVSMGLDVSGVDTPYAALAAYLNSLRNTDGSGDANSWQNLATDCPSDGPTMRARFLAYTNGAVALLNAIAAKAATTASYAYLSGTPSNAIANTAITIKDDGTLTGGGGGQVTIPGLGQTSYRVVSVGGSASNAPTGAGIYINGGASQTYGASRSYSLLAIRRSDGAVVWGPQTYDIYGSGALTGGRNAATLATDLNNANSSLILVLWTYDEPRNNRLDSGLADAIYRCGGSRAVYASPNFKARAAYILVGIGGCGEGNGAEAYQGSIDDDPNAWCDLTFTLTKGVITGISSTFTPKSLTDYGYTGDLNATRNAVTYAASAPGSPVDGDLWVDTSATFAVFKLRSGGVWVTGANALSAYTALSGIPLSLADINTTESTKLTGIAAGATKNTVYYQDTDPGSVADGSIWVSSTKAWQRVGGGWVAYVGAGSVNTGDLSTSAATSVVIFYGTGASYNNYA